MTETNQNEQDSFLDLLTRLWRYFPDLTFGDLVMRIYCGLNPTFSQFGFIKFPLEGWQKSLEGIMETLDEP